MAFQESGADVSIFVFDKARHASNDDRVLAARNCLKRLKSLRHPSMLKFVDGTESETSIFIVVEAVKPLRLGGKNDDAPQMSADVIALGLHQIGV
jgi:SCY1-like protein 1